MNRIFLFASVFCFCIACAEKNNLPALEQKNSPTTSLLQAISMVDSKTVWISGHDASFVRSLDAGESWDLFQYDKIDSLQFRDIHGFNSTQAILMSSGAGSLSRILTFEAPDHWEENFVMEDLLGFLDCFDFWDEKRGVAYGDAIDDYPYILLTKDGGKSWLRADTTMMPKAGIGEGGFAASGTCVTTGEDGLAWVATGAGGNARFLLTKNYGVSWEAIDSPIVKGEAAGNTSVSFAGKVGFAVGGDLTKMEAYTQNCAFTSDGGASWSLGAQPKTKGAFYGGAIANLDNEMYAFACGPNGIDYSSDLGTSWNTLDTMNYWSIAFNEKLGFASGKEGRIVRIQLNKNEKN